MERDLSFQGETRECLVITDDDVFFLFLYVSEKTLILLLYN